MAELVGVLFVAISRHGLPVVAALAQGLPVTLVPEQYRVTSVRFDMIYNYGLGYSIIGKASKAQLISFKKWLPCFSPPTVVATLAWCVSFIKILMVITESILR